MSVEHYENFPVASVLCPPAIRGAVEAIYHFARTADDLADEGDAPTAQRQQDLQAYRAELRALYGGGAAGGRWPRVFSQLAVEQRRHRLPQEPLEALLEAFLHDAANPRYAQRRDLLWYCQRSANPVGRLLLHLYGLKDEAALTQSDAICTALQLINFWQDLGTDLARGRVYLPMQELSDHGLTVDDVRAPSDERIARACQSLLRSLCEWAVGLMHQGAPLCHRLPGRAGWELRLVVQGGLRVAEKIRRAGYRTWSVRPTVRAADAPLLLWRAWRMGDATPAGRLAGGPP